MTNVASAGSLLRIADLSGATVLDLLDRAEWLRDHRREWPRFERSVVGLFFLQPSTRTLLGFSAAAVRLGSGTVSLSEARFGVGMSAAETLEDTIRSVTGYVDAIVLRHPDPWALTAAAVCADVPVINAGSGEDEHPTQALIDLLALRAVRREISGLRIGFVGDLAGSRAAHSLLRALSHFPPAEARLISPLERRLPEEIRRQLPFTVSDFDALCLEGLDAVYVAGLPEGAGEHRLSEDVRGRFRLTARNIRALAACVPILCPLPRIDEIDSALDCDPRARYFSQSSDGLFMRGAVLERALSGRAFS